MKMKFVAAVAGATIAAASAIPPTAANAATSPTSITVTACSATSPWSATVSASSVVWTDPNDTLSVTNNCATGGTSQTIAIWVHRGSSYTFLAPIPSGNSASTGALGSDVTSVLVTTAMGGVSQTLATLSATSPSSGGGGSSSSTGSGPAPIIQQFGKPIVGTCNDASPSTLNWANVSSGGWGESWSQWMHGGNGGFVCTRTLTYSTAAARWVIG